jgi:2'-hydroxyisoflavone reductase
VESVQKGVGSNPTYTWVAADFLRANGHAPYGRQLPCFQVMTGPTAGFARFDLTPEMKAGLTYRSMEVTARDTIAWFRREPAERQAKPLLAGFTPEREAELLRLWKAR